MRSLLFRSYLSGLIGHPMQEAFFLHRITDKFFNRSGSHLSSQAVSSQVLSAASVLTIVFGMGTGVSPTRIATGSFEHSLCCL